MTFLTLPLLRWWQVAHRQPGLDSLLQWFHQPRSLLLLALPLAVIEWLWGNVGLGGWNMLTYPLFFLYGAFLFTRQPVAAIFCRAMGPALVGALSTTTLLLVTVYVDGMVAFGPYPHDWQRILHAVSGWCWMVVFLGLAYRSLTVRTPFLTYANEAVLPFYILHQTVIILVGYAIIKNGWSAAASYGGVLVGSLLGICLLYVGLIRPVSILRLLFGLKA